jgi:anthranilate/para-aminobenzoate synthase component I
MSIRISHRISNLSKTYSIPRINSQFIYVIYWCARKILEDITKTSHRDLDDELKRRHAEIKDEFRREQTKMQEDFKKEKNSVRQLLYGQFNQAVNRLNESIKKGDYEGEVAHRMTADWLNSELKKRGY